MHNAFWLTTTRHARRSRDPAADAERMHRLADNVLLVTDGR